VMDPLPPSDFSLLTPEDGEVIISSEIEFSWENSVDPNDGDVVEYQLWLELVGDSINIVTLEPQITVFLDTLELNLESENSLSWWVISSSNGDTIYSQERFSFSYQPETISGDQAEIPVKFGIQSLHPNPFNSQLNIRYGLLEKSRVRISIVDISGRVIDIVENRYQQAGYHILQWQAVGVSTGMYFITLTAEEGAYRDAQKVIMLK